MLKIPHCGNIRNVSGHCKRQTTEMKEKSKPNFAIPLLPSISINETVEFYKAIGSEITYQQKAPNNYVGIKLKNIEIHFFGMKQIKPEANFSSSYLVVDDIDFFYNSCREGLKKIFGKIPIKGIPRINQIKDMPTYGVRQFIIVDPSGNYLRIGQPIPKTDSVLFEENGKKPHKGTALTKAYELADRLANGKDDVAASVKVIDKVLSEEANSNELEYVFRILTLRLDIAHRMDDLETAKQMIKKGNDLLKNLGENILTDEDLANYRRIRSEVKTTNR